MQDAGSICLCNRPRGRPVMGLTERERRLECLAGMHKEGRVIVPDLMVSDMARSVRFDRDTRSCWRRFRAWPANPPCSGSITGRPPSGTIYFRGLHLDSVRDGVVGEPV